MRYIADSHNWWSSPYDGNDAWEDDCVDKEEFYNSLCTWKQEAVDELQTEEAKDELLHKFWLEDERKKWEEMNS